jgi:ribosomal protein S18 acetylase RimI-like enzyme
VVGYLHFDSEGAEPELHRIYVDPAQKRGGIGSALMLELHARLRPGASYILLVAEANTAAQSFYERHGLVVERRIEGNSHYSNAMNLELESQPQPAAGVLMRFTKTAA